MVPVSKGYGLALNHIFFLAGSALARNKFITVFFRIFERSFPPRKLKPIKWNVALMFESLTWPLYKPLRLAADKYLSYKIQFLLDFTLT